MNNKKEQEVRNVAIYSRKSKFTGKGESIGNQVEICKEYLKSKYGSEFENIKFSVFEDEGYSGGNTNRPQFQELMSEIKKHKFDTLICYRLDRISRNTADFVKMIEEIKKYNVSFISVKESFDTTSPMGVAMMMLSSIFAQLERDTIAERIRDNMLELAKTGRWLGGTTPTGYESVRLEKTDISGKKRYLFKLNIIDDEIKIIRLIFDKFLETNSLTKTETYLLNNGYKTKNNKPFTRFAIRSILENPVYMIADNNALKYFRDCEVEVFSEENEFNGQCGIMAYNKTKQTTGSTHIKNNIDDWIISVGKHKGIICGSEWVKVQGMLMQNKSKSFRKPRNNIALLSGVLVCGNCGRFMRPKQTNRLNKEGEKIFYYLCETKEKSRNNLCEMQNLNGNLIDRMVCDEVKKLSRDDSLFFSQLKKAKKTIGHNSKNYYDEIDGLEKKIVKNEKTIQKLVLSLADDEDSISKKYIDTEIKKLDEENILFRNKINEIKTVSKDYDLSESDFEMLKDILSSFTKTFDIMTLDEKRNTIRTLIRRIVWDGENVHIYFFGSDIDEIGSNRLSDDEMLPLCKDCKNATTAMWKGLKKPPQA